MKKSRILLGALIAILMVALLGVTAMAATVTPGGSTSISFSVSDVCGVQVIGGSASGGSVGGYSVSGGTSEGSVGYSDERTNFWISADFSAPSNAKVGDTYSVTIDYFYSNDGPDLQPTSYTETVTVVGGSSGGGDTPITPDQPTKPDKPSEPAVKIDYSELNKWIKEKQGLDSSKYTKDTCEKCGAPLYIRDDDKPETVLNRISVYNDKTQPLIDFYDNKGLLKNVDGNRTPEEVLADIKALVESI